MMLFIDGAEVDYKLHEKTIEQMIGRKHTFNEASAFSHIDSIELEDTHWYFNTNNGVTIAFHINGLEPPWPEKKCLSMFSNLIERIIEWNNRMMENPVACIEAIEACTVLNQRHITAKNAYTIALGYINGSARALQSYHEDRERIAKHQWKKHEIPLCPKCLEAGLGYGVNIKPWCHRHEWFDETLFEDWHYHLDGRIACHISPIQKGWKPLPDKQWPQKESTPTMQCDVMVLDWNRVPINEIPGDLIDDYGNRMIHIYNIARDFMDSASFYRVSDKTKSWAETCMNALKEDIEALRARKEALKIMPIQTPSELPKLAMTRQEMEARLESIDWQLKTIETIWTPEKQAAAKSGELDAVTEQCNTLWNEYFSIIERLKESP